MHHTTRRRLLRVAGAMAGVAAVAVATAGPAAAGETARSIGSCSADGYRANYEVLYHDTGGRHVVDRLVWDLGGERLGPRSNVVARVKEDNSWGHDKIYYTHVSADDVPGGRTEVPVPDGISVPDGKKMYVEYTFVFDRRDGDDPRCVGHTSNV